MNAFTPLTELLDLRHVQRAYKDANPFDELALLFPEYDKATSIVPGIGWIDATYGAASHGGTFRPRQQSKISRYGEDASELHHISGGILGTPRYDVVTNLIHLSAATHRFCERYTADGFALCMAVKLLKREWDEEAMRRMMRVDSCAGWISTRKLQWPWVDAVAEKCVRMTAKAGMGDVA